MALSGQVIFCEDIRQEVNGKYMLIGVYTGHMLVPSFPTQQRVCAFLRLEDMTSGNHLFEYGTSEGAVFATFGSELQVEADAVPPFYLPIPPAALSFSQAATLRLRTREESETEWTELGSLSIDATKEPVRSAFTD